MAITTASIVETPDAELPFKVILQADGQAFAEHAVNSRRSAQELIDNILPVLDSLPVRTSHALR